MFRSLLISKRRQVFGQADRYRAGVEKLQATADSVSEMQERLEALQPQLMQTSQETERMLVNIENQKKEADAARAVIKEEEKIAEKNAAEAKRISVLCEGDLKQVLPVLESAERAVKILNKNDIYEIKSMKSPPQGVKLVMEAVCILKGE